MGIAASVQSGCLIHGVRLDWSNRQCEVHIGNHSYIVKHPVLYGAGGLHVGDDVLIGADAVIITQGRELII